MIWPQLEKLRAAEVFEELFKDGLPVSSSRIDFNRNLNLDIAAPFIKLRSDLKKVYDAALSSRMKGFDIDRVMSLELYSTTIEMKIPMRVAASMPFWYWVSLKLLPDLLFNRFPQMDKEALRGRYYERNMRVWPYMLWWGAHLTWQGNRKDTESVLKQGFSVSAIEVFLDRSGSGYRTNLFREIAAQFAIHNTNYLATDKDLLRPVMGLNTSKIVNIEPEFYSDGIKGYVKDLFAPFIKNLKPRNK